MHLHGGLGPIRVPAAQEVDDLPVVRDGVGGQVGALLVVLDLQVDGLVDHLHQLHGKLVVSSCRQGVVEVLLRTGPVFPGGDDLLHLDAVFVDALD